MAVFKIRLAIMRFIVEYLHEFKKHNQAFQAIMFPIPFYCLYILLLSLLLHRSDSDTFRFNRGRKK